MNSEPKRQASCWDPLSQEIFRFVESLGWGTWLMPAPDCAKTLGVPKVDLPTGKVKGLGGYSSVSVFPALLPELGAGSLMVVRRTRYTGFTVFYEHRTPTPEEAAWLLEDVEANTMTPDGAEVRSIVPEGYPGVTIPPRY